MGDDRGAPGVIRRALDGLGQVPDALLVDGPVNVLRRADDPEPYAGVVRPVVDGDARCVSVAAASVLAKVIRDRIMREEADHFPAYAFERNKGYPSLVHQTALRGYGPSAIHRRSWAFMEELPWRGNPCPVRTPISCVDDRQGQLFASVLNLVEARIGLAFSVMRGGLTSPNPNPKTTPPVAAPGRPR